MRVLPALEREAIPLSFDAELTCGEIGDVLSLAEQEAAQLLVRALKRLKGRMEAA
jgi:DNA-directed RNA polymerase specialized sigma subunit